MVLEDVEMVIHLYGGPGQRRIKFVGSELKGFHAQERAVVIIVKVISLQTLQGIWKKLFSV